MSVLLGQRRVVLVPEAGVQRQPVGDPPVVLHEQIAGRLREIDRVPGLDGGLLRNPQQEVGQIVAAVRAGEDEGAARVRRRAAVGTNRAQVAAKSDGVPIVRPGDGVADRQRAIDAIDRADVAHALHVAERQVGRSPIDRIGADAEKARVARDVLGIRKQVRRLQVLAVDAEPQRVEHAPLRERERSGNVDGVRLRRAAEGRQRIRAFVVAVTIVDRHVQVRRALAAAAAAAEPTTATGLSTATRRRRAERLHHPQIDVVELRGHGRDVVEVLRRAGLVRQWKEREELLRRGIESRRRNLVVRERPPGGGIDDRTSQRGEVAGTLGERGHRRVRVVRVARMVPRVVQEEERPRAVHHFRNGQRTADGHAEPLLQILGFVRRLPVQREGRGIERRRVEALEDRAADLLTAAPAAPERTAERRAAAECAGPAKSAGAEPATAPWARRSAACARLPLRAAVEKSEALRKVARAVRTEEEIVLLRGAGRRHRLRGRLGRKSRRQDDLRRRGIGAARIVGAREARLIRKELQALKRLRSARLAAAATGCRLRRRRRRRALTGRCRRARRERHRQIDARRTRRRVDRDIARRRRERRQLRRDHVRARDRRLQRVAAVGRR